MNASQEVQCQVCGETGWVKLGAPLLCPDHAAAQRRRERDAAIAEFKEVVLAPFERPVRWLDRQLRRWPWLYRRLSDRDERV